MMTSNIGLLESLKIYLENSSITGYVAVACSGGIDSISLLKAFSLVYKPELIYCLHCDHGWREDSFKAIDFLEKYSSELGVNFKFKELNLEKYDEAKAREARYEALEKICIENSINNLFLGHNLNDQAETIIFRIFRGTGTKGLMGIPQKRTLESGLEIHRPFLSLSRKLIEDFVQTYSLKYIEDPSNNNIDYSRNRIRHMVISEALEINPKAVENIDSLAKIISEEQKYFDQEIEKTLNELGELPWSLEEFRKYPRTIQRKILEKMFINSINFSNEFLKAIEIGGFQKINYQKNKFFLIKQKMIFNEKSNPYSEQLDQTHP